MKFLVVYVHYGPYHLARAKALLERTEVDPIFVELVGSQNSHPWLRGKRELPIQTLLQGPFEAVRQNDLVAQMHEELRRIRPDVVATTGYGLKVMRIVARWAAQGSGGSVLFHETARQDRKRHFWKEVFKRRIIAQNYHSALVGGESHACYLQELGFPPERMWKPHSVVDNDAFDRAAFSVRRESSEWRLRLGLPERYFLFVGRLAPEKNVFRLIEAYEKYRQVERNGWGLVILGDGPLRKELEALVEARTMPDVCFPGFLPSEDLPPYYALAGCFVLPSLIEPWGLVVNEAMACSLPVAISNRCGCAPDLVSERNGFVFEPKNVAGLAELLDRISRMGDGDREAMGKVSRQIIDRFGPRAWADGAIAAATCAWELRKRIE